MPLSDRIVYQGIYAAIIQRKENPKDDAETKRKKRLGKLTIFQKNALLKAAFTYENKYLNTLDLVKAKVKRPNRSLNKIAKDVDMIFRRISRPWHNAAEIMESIAALDSESLLELVHLSTPGIPKKPAVVEKKGGNKENVTGFYSLIPAGMVQIDPVDPKLFWKLLSPAFGFMHLERLRFTPLGAEPGELLYSLPLAPGEEVVLSHKTWAKTTKEFTELVQSIIEKEITTQRTESLELSESTKNQSEFAASMSTSVQGGGNIGVVKISGTTSNTLSASLSNTKEESVKRNMQTTEQATARSKQEHKTTFQVSSEVGYEDESHRKIKNPNRTHAVRYDYFRYMRKWKIDLERYGVRLTMDVMVPKPGDNLRKEFDERKALEDILNGTDECPYTAADIDESNLPAGVGPKPLPTHSSQTGEYDPITTGNDEEDHHFTIPPGYEADYAHATRTGGGGHAEVVPSDTACHGQRGDVTLQVHRGVAGLEGRVAYTVYLYIKPTTEKIEEWQNSVLQAMRQEWTQQRQAAKVDAQTRLDSMVVKERDIPTLILRQDEREEIMAEVMTLFLPPTMPPKAAPYPVVKFMHEAFEWENMSYFLYPYFWQDIKSALEIEHSDPLRRDILRAGWARVLLPVRPLYEDKVLAYAYNGDPDGLIASNMRTVAQQIMDANKTTYSYESSPGNITSEKFKVVASWYEYTPTDAINIKIKLIDDDIAEPRLAEQLSDEHEQRTEEKEMLQAAKDVRGKIVDAIENLPDDAKIKTLKSGSGDEIELDTDSGE